MWGRYSHIDTSPPTTSSKMSNLCYSEYFAEYGRTRQPYKDNNLGFSFKARNNEKLELQT
jgi:hypothetical protein